MNNKMLLIDTETGGLDASRHSILSISALVLNYEGTVVDGMYTLVNEGASVIAEKSALPINGLTMTTVQELGVSPVRAVALLYDLLWRQGMTHGVVVVAHNVRFDFAFLQRLFREANIDAMTFEALFSHRTICTQAGAGLLMQAGVIKPESTSLASLCQYFGVALPREDGHNARTDALATAEVFRHLLQRCREGL
jgi:DNA polymerase-3 subunit epsilon